MNEDKILKRYNGLITGLHDLVADRKPSIFFPLLTKLLFRFMSNNPEVAVKQSDVKLFRKLHFIIMFLGKRFLSCLQQIHRETTLPNEPVIFIANHAFKDDVLATVLAAKIHAYIMIGSLPAIHNSLDGIALRLNGALLVNRKMKDSRKVSLEKSKRILEFGSDLIMFPEGVWNKSPNKLILDLWGGFI